MQRPGAALQVGQGMAKKGRALQSDPEDQKLKHQTDEPRSKFGRITVVRQAEVPQ
jgi:hypothetical protein